MIIETLVIMALLLLFVVLAVLLKLSGKLENLSKKHLKEPYWKGGKQ